MGKRWIIGLCIIAALGILLWAVVIIVPLFPIKVEKPKYEKLESSKHIEDKKTISFCPNWFPEVEFAGYYLAQQKGLYSKYGLNVEIIPYSLEYNIPESLAAGKLDFGILSMQDLVASSFDKLDLIAVAAIFQRDPSVFLVMKESGIYSPADFVGKKIVVKNESWRMHILRVLEKSGLSENDVSFVSGGDDLTPFFRGEVDIWTGYAHDEPVEVELAGFSINIILSSDFGIEDYQGLIVTTRKKVSREPKVVSAFVAASLYGWDYVLSKHEDGLDAVKNADPGLSISFQRKAIKHLLPFINPGENPIGWIDENRWVFSLDEWGVESPLSLYTSKFLDEIYTGGIGRELVRVVK